MATPRDFPLALLLLQVGRAGPPSTYTAPPIVSLVPTPRAPPGERVGSGVDETRVVSSHEV